MAFWGKRRYQLQKLGDHWVPLLVGGQWATGNALHLGSILLGAGLGISDNVQSSPLNCKALGQQTTPSPACAIFPISLQP